MDFIRRMSDKGKNGTGTERIRIAESNRNFLISNPVLKKLISRFLVLGTAFSLLLSCISCTLASNFPLSDSNNCHEKKLEGTWIEKKQVDGKTQTETIEIYDTGSIYNVKFIEKNGETGIPFILTKLESYYFISFPYGKDLSSWWIYRVQFDDNKLLILGLNKKGWKLAEKILKKSDDKIYITISQRELQQWCVKNANLFSEKKFCYERAKGMSTKTQVAPITKNAEDLSKVTVKAKDGVR